ncbi:MAG: glycosyltransferase family 2 protein [Alphaproteobacteria bacterium]
MNTLILIPALNEAENLSFVIDSIPNNFDVLVVDDGSADNTSEIAEALGATVVSHNQNLGYDAAIESGLIFAHKNKYKFCITIDADGQHSSQLLCKFNETLRIGADLVYGSRNEFGCFAEFLYAIVCKLRFGINDPMCGMKGYRVDTIMAAVFEINKYNLIGSEVLLKAVRIGMRVRTVDVQVKRRLNGESRFGGLFVANYRTCCAIVRSFRV